MRYHLLLSLVFGLAVAVPSPSAETLGKWTVSDVRRSRELNNTFCKWTMRITDATATTSSYSCDINVLVAEGDDCGTADFPTRHCFGGTEMFTVNGGHDDEGGFVVMVLVDNVKKSESWFGFADMDLDAGKDIAPQTALAYPLGTDSHRRSLATDSELPGPREENASVATTWELSSILRAVFPKTHEIQMDFWIHDGTRPEGVPCFVRIFPPDGVDLATWQWYDRKCEESGYYISWGYLAASDAGIMTVINPARDTKTFFGFPGANHNQSRRLNPPGPSKALPCDCGKVQG